MASLKEYWDEREKVRILTESRKRVPSRKHQDSDDSRPPQNLMAKTKSKRKSDGRNDDLSKTNASKKKANTNQGNITTSALGDDSASDGVVMEEDAGEGIATSTLGGDAASEGIVMVADTSVLNGDAVSKGVVMEADTSALGGDAASERVVMEAEVAGVGTDANMPGDAAADDAVGPDVFEEELK